MVALYELDNDPNHLGIQIIALRDFEHAMRVYDGYCEDKRPATEEGKGSPPEGPMIDLVKEIEMEEAQREVDAGEGE